MTFCRKIKNKNSFSSCPSLDTLYIQLPARDARKNGMTDTLKYLPASSRITESNVQVFYSAPMNEKFSGCREQFRVVWEFRDPAYWGLLICTPHGDASVDLVLQLRFVSSARTLATGDFPQPSRADRGIACSRKIPGGGGRKRACVWTFCQKIFGENKRRRIT